MTSEQHTHDETISPNQPRNGSPGIFWLLFLVIVVGTSFWMAGKPTTQRTIVVPVRTIPAYHLLTATDLTTKTLAAEGISSDVAHSEAAIVNLYATVPLAAGQPIVNAHLQSVPDTKFITQTLVMAIPATPAMVMGGNVYAGNLVDIIFIPPATTIQAPSTTMLFENILVLDVKKVETESATDLLSRQLSYVLVLAIPVDKRDEFVFAHAHAHKVMTALKSNP